MFRKIENEYVKTLYKCKESTGLLNYLYRYKLHKLSLKSHIQIPYTITIGENFSIGHFGRTIVNPKTIIGNNVCINAGAIIGQENRGIREGCPIIGNNVWIGTNAAIVGKINIGNDVLIAPNAYVNFDVPDHSIVIGNPGKIIEKDDATKGYLH